MKICSIGAELFHVGGRTDRHDKANSRFSQFCLNTKVFCKTFETFNSSRDRHASANCFQNMTHFYRILDNNVLWFMSHTDKVGILYRDSSFHWSFPKYLKFVIFVLCGPSVYFPCNRSHVPESLWSRLCFFLSLYEWTIFPWQKSAEMPFQFWRLADKKRETSETDRECIT
jgi:hypothetical protein